MRYWRKSLRVVFFMRFIPYVRMIGLNGSMATGTVNSLSDIDLYIITKGGTILACRTLTAGFVQLLGVRAHDSKKVGRLCLNRYAVEKYPIILDKNEYHARVFHNLIPLFAVGDSYNQYLVENEWMKDFGYPVICNEIVFTDTIFSKLVRGLGELLLSPFILYLEEWLYRRQLARMNRDPRVIKGSTKVVISRKELRFHL